MGADEQQSLGRRSSPGLKRRAALWRMRAEEMRTVAEEMTHLETKAIMLRIAGDYDRLAKKVEEEARASHSK